MADHCPHQADGFRIWADILKTRINGNAVSEKCTGASQFSYLREAPV